MPGTTFLPIKFLLSGILLLFIPILFDDITPLFVLSIVLLLSFFVAKILASSSVDKILLINIILSLFLISISYAVICHIGNLEKGGFFIFSDQDYFFRTASDLAKSQSIENIFKTCFIDRDHIENEGAHFLFGSIGYICNKYLGSNSVLIQYVCVSFFLILSGLFFYKLLLNFVPPWSAYRYSLAFCLFSPIFYYSPWMLRDLHVAFFYLVGFYLVYRKLSISTLICFILLFVVIFEFRFEHGLFFLVFFFAHLYINKERSKLIRTLWPFFLLIGCSIFIYLLVLNYDTLKASLEVLEYYSEFTTDELTDNSLGAKLYRLPPVFKELTIVLYSQLTPLPPWVDVNFDDNIFIILPAFILLIVAIYWSYIFIFLIFSFFCNKQVFRKLSFSFIILLLIAILFLFLNTSNINVRRIMAVYPIFFILYIRIKEDGPSLSKNKMIGWYASITYASLLFLYILVKFLI